MRFFRRFVRPVLGLLGCSLICVAAFAWIFLKNKSILRILPATIIIKLLWAAGRNAIELARGILILYKKGPALVTEQNIESIIQAFSHLKTAGILNQRNFDLIVANAQYASNLSSGFAILEQSGILNQSNFDLIVAHAQNLSLAELHQYGADLITSDNIQLLVTAGVNVGNVVAAIGKLRRDCGEDLITPEIIKLVTQAGGNASDIATAIGTLHTGDPRLVTKEIIQLLVTNGRYASNIATAIVKLRHDCGEDLITLEIIKLVIQAGGNASIIADAIITLSKGHRGLVTKEIIQLLLTNGRYDSNIATAIVKLRCDCGDIITPEIIELVIQAGSNASIIADAIITLSIGFGIGRPKKGFLVVPFGTGHKDLVTKEIIQIIVRSVVNTDLSHKGLARTIVWLHGINPLIATVDNINSIIAVTAYDMSVVPYVASASIDTLVSGLMSMETAGILDQTNFCRLIDAVKKARVARPKDGILTSWSNALESMTRNGILTQDNFDIIIAYAQHYIVDIGGLCWVLSNERVGRRGASMLTQEYFAIAMSRIIARRPEHATSVALALCIMSRTVLLIPDNISRLDQADHMVAEALIHLDEDSLSKAAGIVIDQQSFDVLIREGANALEHAKEIIRQAQAGMRMRP